MALQQKLFDRNFYYGKIDGKITLDFQKAVNRYMGITATPLIATPPAPLIPPEVPITQTVPAQQLPAPTGFVFYRSYKKWEQSSEIKKLQTLLYNQGFYAGAIDGIYSNQTMDAVFAFQKQQWLLSDSSPAGLKWYLGPGTREALNTMTK